MKNQLRVLAGRCAHLTPSSRSRVERRGGRERARARERKEERKLSKHRKSITQSGRRRGERFGVTATLADWYEPPNVTNVYNASGKRKRPALEKRERSKVDRRLRLTPRRPRVDARREGGGRGRSRRRERRMEINGHHRSLSRMTAFAPPGIVH